MRIEKRKSDGALLISDIINNYYIKKTYIGYTKSQAISIFKKQSQKEYLDFKYNSQFLI